MEKMEPKKLAELYVDYYLREWSNIPYQIALTTSRQTEMLEWGAELEEQSHIPVGRVGRIGKELYGAPDWIPQWNGRVEDLIVRRSTKIGRFVDDIQTGAEKLQTKWVKRKAK